MILMSAHDVKQLKAEIRECMRRCPNSVCNGSFQTVVDYKRAISTAHRALGNERPSSQVVFDALSGLRQFGD